MLMLQLLEAIPGAPDLLSPLATHGVLGLLAAIALSGYIWERRENRRLNAVLVEKIESITKTNLESAQESRRLTEFLQERYDRRGR